MQKSSSSISGQNSEILKKKKILKAAGYMILLLYPNLSLLSQSVPR